VKLGVLSCVPESHGQLLHLSSQVALTCAIHMREALTCNVATYVNIYLGSFSFYDSHKLYALSWPRDLFHFCKLLEILVLDTCKFLLQILIK
jgi:hypothetical protein